MREQMFEFSEELVAYVFHPDRLDRIAKKLHVCMEDVVLMY